MKTEVTMLRFLDDDVVRQKSKTELFNATDLLKNINKRRVAEGKGMALINNYLASNNTKEFLKELSIQKKIELSKLVIVNKKAGTWVHPYVLMDIALWSYPKLKVRIYDWIYDELLKNRNQSGDAFKEMNLVLDKYFKIGGRYWVYANTANTIADELNMPNIKNRWQKATEIELKNRTSLENEIISATLYGKHKKIEDCIGKAISVWRERSLKIEEK